MNKIFAAFKPRGLSSNAFLHQLKKKYKNKKAGYSGTLDPFAKGVLIVAFGQYTKLFRFLKKTPKTYKATLWLGMHSLSLDDQNIQEIKTLKAFKLTILEQTIKKMQGKISYTPPTFSAKKVNGIRAYELARRGLEVNLKPSEMEIFNCKILSYNHPFLNIQISVSEGSYIRSYCELFARKLGIYASLSSLERVKEGEFVYNNEESLDILKYLDLKPNFIKNPNKLQNGLLLSLEDLTYCDEGSYYIETKKYFSIINIKENTVKYLLNKVEKC
ncbi:tRNA pseudouridine(55) synthase TruB [Campylobacter sp. VicNov18]|uniref:tRNA pseudouridine(55) synthase TruB n=1 Tax=Campylobacter bilis TaxID=2691918 RepID=UPI00130E2E75|nr:tRNA pseudouridine(55) synthase TruB [Campylobacter bilis]MPV63655.1 tRNA pseudouridine(55) synthase TruB [Campylobacter hepaticus]MBM0637156.1 tRNA pseudouridine(55) synthase TruB [Campylobacter bilis]MCC8277872.1 tRNA pseudouridine(55) synthase TruB [Campylobacter bilis]MCC8298803.1 tRNA pseudouridine(55) synthase TruB [Campylobacter bilis]MCC8300782.1 tRNA pseudouridine(55) synthase TruB [Campylobacter bilis]